MHKLQSWTKTQIALVRFCAHAKEAIARIQLLLSHPTKPPIPTEFCIGWGRGNRNTFLSNFFSSAFSNFSCKTQMNHCTTKVSTIVSGISATGETDLKIKAASSGKRLSPSTTLVYQWSKLTKNHSMTTSRINLTVVDRRNPDDNSLLYFQTVAQSLYFGLAGAKSPSQ